MSSGDDQPMYQCSGAYEGRRFTISTATPGAQSLLLTSDDDRFATTMEWSRPAPAFPWGLVALHVARPGGETVLRYAHGDARVTWTGGERPFEACPWLHVGHVEAFLYDLASLDWCWRASFMYTRIPVAWIDFLDRGGEEPMPPLERAGPARPWAGRLRPRAAR